MPNFTNRLEELDVRIGATFEDLMDGSEYDQVLDPFITVINVDTNVTLFPFDGPGTDMERWDALKKSFDFEMHDLEIRTGPWARLAEYDREKLKTSNIIDVAGRIADRLARASRRIYTKLVVDALESGLTTKSWDGKYLFAADHDIGGGTYVNNTASSAFNLANFTAAYNTFGKVPLADGSTLSGKPTHLFYPSSLEAKVDEVLNSRTVLRDGIAQDNLMFQKVTPVMLPQLKNQTAWYLGNADDELFVVAQLTAPHITSQLEGSDLAYYQHKYSWSVEGNFGILIPSFTSIARYTP